MDKVSLIFKVLSGHAARHEQILLDHWVLQARENRQEFDDVKLLWENSQGAGFYSQENIEESFGKIKNRMRVISRRREQKRLLIRLGLVMVFGLVIGLLIHHEQVESAMPKAITFDHVRLGNVITAIGYRYNVDIKVDDPMLLNCVVTATFYRIDRAEDAVNTLAQSLGVQAHAIDHHTYELTGPGCFAR